MPPLFAALAALPAAAAPEPGPTPPPANERLARGVLGDLVAVHSVHAVGTVDAARVITARLQAAGFSGRDLQVAADPMYPHQVNVVARLRGKGLGKPVLWIGHLDIVEAKADDWTLPPFALTEQDGYFYGRGTSDMKGPDAAVLASLVRLKQEGFVPDRDIIAAFTADEEVGLEQDGVDFLLRRRRDLVDAGLVVNPDGYSGELSEGRRTDSGIETSQKTYVTFLLEATNRGGHSSQPRPDNAIYSLAAGLMRLQAFRFPIGVNDTTRLYFSRMARLNGGQRSADMLAVAASPPDQAAAAPLAEDTALNALLRSTCVATMLSAGHQENALPQRAQATVQCRIMPGEAPVGTRETLVRALADPSISVTQPDPVVSSPNTTPDPDFLRRVEKVTLGMWPGVAVIPGMAAGASDSLYTRNAGIPSYGVSGAWNDVGDDRDHGRDERVSVASFYESVEFTYRLMKELSHK